MITCVRLVDLSFGSSAQDLEQDSGEGAAEIPRMAPHIECISFKVARRSAKGCWTPSNGWTPMVAMA